MIGGDYPKYHKCHMCGKKFWVGTLVEDWTFKTTAHRRVQLWFCGWNCYSKYLKEREKKHEKSMHKDMPQP